MIFGSVSKSKEVNPAALHRARADPRASEIEFSLGQLSAKTVQNIIVK